MQDTFTLIKLRIHSKVCSNRWLSDILIILFLWNNTQSNKQSDKSEAAFEQ